MSTYDAIVQALPLTIQGVEVMDPVLTLFGDGWSLTLMCPWTVEGPGISSSWESEDLEDVVWDEPRGGCRRSYVDRWAWSRCWCW